MPTIPSQVDGSLPLDGSRVAVKTKKNSAGPVDERLTTLSSQIQSFNARLQSLEPSLARFQRVEADIVRLITELDAIVANPDPLLVPKGMGPPAPQKPAPQSNAKPESPKTPIPETPASDTLSVVPIDADQIFDFKASEPAAPRQAPSKPPAPPAPPTRLPDDIPESALKFDPAPPPAEPPATSGQDVSIAGLGTWETGRCRAYGLHLASFFTEPGLAVGQRLVRSRNGDLLGQLDFFLTDVELKDGRGVFKRLLLGPIAQVKTARSLCERIKARGRYCAAMPLKNPDCDAGES